MATYKVVNGKLVDDSGNPLKIGEDEIIVDGYKSQDDIDRAVKDRLARQKEQIATLEATASKTPELERMLDSLKAEKAELEQQAANIKAETEKRTAQEISKATKRAEELDAALAQERTARVRDQVTNQILGHSGAFINPLKDVVPDLLARHKREPIMGEDGKPSGKFNDLFELEYDNEAGKRVKEWLPVDKAVSVLASQEAYHHYVKPSGQGGSGGGDMSKKFTNIKRSAMSEADKIAFTDKHGLDAFKALPA